MKIIKNDGKIISIIYRDSDWVKGLNFITPDELFVQVGSWWYDKGRKLDSHIHKEFDRVANRTQETIYVKQGSVKVLLFSEKEVFFEEYIAWEFEDNPYRTTIPTYVCFCLLKDLSNPQKE